MGRQIVSSFDIINTMNKRDAKIVIGLMSGTSIDGIDACIVRINPDLSYKMINNLVLDFPENIKNNIFELFKPKVDIELLCKMNFLLAEYFSQAVIDVTKKAGMKPSDIDLIGSHGQTIYHSPKNEYINDYPTKSTLQIGDSSIIAERTGITVISDFRTRDMAAGGDGAPLVCFADNVIFGNDKKSRIIQNIGGIANATVISPNIEPIAFDTGPGNMLIDHFVKKLFNMEYDKDGEISSQGKVNYQWLDKLLEEPFYTKLPPKTTGRELFSKEYADIIYKSAPDNNYDIIATITALTATTITNAYKNFILSKSNIDEVILGGGGAYNPTLKSFIQANIPDIEVKTHEHYGISSKFKEAIAFALLAYTSYYNIPNNCPSCTGARNYRVLGKLTRGSKL